jgi:hypothetical protein
LICHRFAGGSHDLFKIFASCDFVYFVGSKSPVKFHAEVITFEIDFVVCVGFVFDMGILFCKSFFNQAGPVPKCTFLLNKVFASTSLLGDVLR